MESRSRWIPTLATAMLLAGGCGDSVAPPDATPADAGVTDVAAVDVPHLAPACAHDVRVQAYAVGTQREGASVRLRLDGVDPPPGARFNYAWTLAAADLAGAPLEGLTMTARPWMPDHGHGASVVPTISALGGGRYAVANVDLFMAGVWTVTFSIHLPSGATDTVAFAVCIGD